MTDPQVPGWYDDPGGSVGQLRWWDGSGWSGIVRDRMPHERPAEPPPQPPPPQVAWSASEVLDADERPRQPRWAWLTVLGIVGVIGLLVLTGVLPGMDTKTPRSVSPAGQALPPLPEPTGEPPTWPPPGPPTPQPPRPVSGRIVDPAAGLSYDVLPGPWRAWDKFTFDGMLSSTGYYRVVQENVPLDGEYWANVNSGLVSPAAASRNDLVATAGRLVSGLDAAYYPKHTRRDVQQHAITVDGRPAYLVRYLAVFDPASSAGYRAKSEQVTVLVVDTGRQLPSVLYVSLPDLARSAWGSVDALLASVRIVH